MKIKNGTLICWGLKAAWLEMPIANLPADTVKVRRRFRKGMPVTAFVKTPNRITRWVLGPNGKSSSLKLCVLLDVNQIKK